MHLIHIEVINLAIVCFIFPYANGFDSYPYSQDQIKNALKNMIQRTYFYSPLYNQLGCWPKNEIPYTISSDFTQEQQQHIIDQIYLMQNRTCVRWVDRRHIPNEVPKKVLFLHGQGESDCRTQEKRSRERDIEVIEVKIFLGDRCFPPRSAVTHEMMHALGFSHEHSRVDRDCYVVVNENNATRPDFAIIYDDETEDVFEKWPYDKRSVMHYPRLPRLSLPFDTTYVVKDKDEPFGGIIWKYRLGDYHGSLWKPHKTGILSCMDAYKINYRFCGAPDFCYSQPKLCQDTEDEERRTGCKQPYYDIARGKVKLLDPA